MDFSGNPQNTKSFSSLIPSYLLKVTKFLGKISQFDFLVMTEKNNFAYKPFSPLNISDFNQLFMWQFQPPWKITPSFPATPSKSWGPVKPHAFWKFGWRLNPLPLEKGRCTYSYFIGLSWHNDVENYILLLFFSVSEETKFKVDTTSIILCYLYHFRNVNKELFRYC